MTFKKGIVCFCTGALGAFLLICAIFLLANVEIPRFLLIWGLINGAILVFCIGV